jgi:glycosyltransferase involved in cell wall biosynthesis
MRILFVAMPTSIHAVRWINQVAGQGWDIHILPSIVSDAVHPEFHGVTIHHDFWGKITVRNQSAAGRRFPFLLKLLRAILRRVARSYYRNKHAVNRLNGVIARIKPDIVHALEFQAAGYLVAEAKKKYAGRFPTWIATNWGSDIYLFGRLPEHASKIRTVLESCDYYSCECLRDVHLAKKYGLKGVAFPVSPNTGGFDFNMVEKLRQPGRPSSRRIIMLKGYQGWAGRALVGLRALERCADILQGYTIVMYSVQSDDVVLAAALFQESTGIPVEILPRETPHRDILLHHGKARISIGVSISDAISTSCLEAMVMGSFPVQSWTSCADEWLVDGETGILVPPEDPDIIEQAIRRALTDDAGVDRAAEKNLLVARDRLDQAMLKQTAISMYRSIAEGKGIAHEE